LRARAPAGYAAARRHRGTVGAEGDDVQARAPGGPAGAATTRPGTGAPSPLERGQGDRQAKLLSAAPPGADERRAGQLPERRRRFDESRTKAALLVRFVMNMTEPSTERPPPDFMSLLATLSARFVNLPADQVDAEIEDAQRRVCEALGLDLSALWQWDPDNPELFVMTHLYRPPGGLPVPRQMDAANYHPWSLKQVLAGRTVALASTEDAPPEAARDLETWRHYGVKTTLNVPLTAGGTRPFGAVSFNDMRNERAWEPELIQRLELVAQVFANAIIRTRTEQALQQSEARLSMAADSAGVGLWSLNLADHQFWLTDKARELFAFKADETVTWDRFLALVHPDDQAAVRGILDAIVQSGEEVHAEYRVVDEDGDVKWMVSRGRLQCRAPGETACAVMGVTADVTARKQAEQELRKALEEVQRLRDRLQDENVYLREQIRSESGHGAIVGESEPVRVMLAMAGKVAATDSAVLITGETGTGKELLAQAIHDQSARGTKTMVKVNCAALPGPLIESELFGREKGAYTGAMTRNTGRFEVADGSSIFLDEIGDLPLDLQARLLRVLQDGKFERLGSHRTLRTDVRIIAATNHDLAVMVQDGRFREDLFHRLNVFPIEVPPLRARKDDIPLLIWKFVQEFNIKMGRTIDSISKSTMDRLKAYPWPGNVRELRNTVERAMILSSGSRLKIVAPPEHQSTSSPMSTLEDLVRRHINDVLERTNWKVSGPGGAAEILDLVPTTLRSRMKKLGISRPTP
jgi:PAS domain S-box-containing protein